MGMIYSGQVNGVSASAAQDVFELLAPSDCVIVVHTIEIAQTSDFGDAQEEGLSILVKRASGSYTSGSGGSTPSKSPFEFGYAASGATLEANNTTQASAGSGALATLLASSWNVRSPWLWVPVPETRIVLSPSQALVVSMSAPADAVTLNASIVWEEIGG